MMKIEAIELSLIRIELKDPFETSFGVTDERQVIIIRLDSGGKSGWGECAADVFPGYSYETIGTAWHILGQFIVPKLLTVDLPTVQMYCESVRSIKGHPMAKAGLEMALWDLQGKIRGESLSQMLGGVNKSVEVGVSIGIQDNPVALIRSTEAYLKAGYKRIKIKIKPGRDLTELEAMRSEFPDIKLQVDANAAYSVRDSHVIQAMEPFDLLMIEQPFAEDDLVDHSKLQAELITPVCLDESIQNLRHTRQAIELDACRIINIKPGRVGGYLEAKSIAEYCQSHNIPVWCGGMLETGIGRAANLALASLEGFTFPSDISASARYYKQDIAMPLFELNPDSTINVPTGEGLGIEVQENVLERLSLKQRRFPAS